MQRWDLLVACLALISPVTLAVAADPSGAAAIVPPGAALETIWEQGEFTEGVAVSKEGVVYFSDIAFSEENPGRVMKFNPDSGEVTVHCADSGKSNGLFFDKNGRLLACCGANVGKQAVCEITPDGEVRVLYGTFKGKKFNAPNDLVVHPSGRIYFSDPRYVGREPMEISHMSVYRVDTDGSIHRATMNIQKPNGVMVSPDGRTLYVAETNNGSVDVTQDDENTKRGRMTLNAFRIRRNGELGRKRVLVDFGDNLGVDGMTVDVEGNIYAAVRSAARHGIIVYTPQGEERAYLPTEELPTNCTFGVGDQSTTLYVTAGTGLYRIRLKVAGYHPELAD